MYSYLKSLTVLFFALFAVYCFAGDPDEEAKLIMKFYSEPHETKGLHLQYVITADQSVRYSFYLGSDLPVWRFYQGKVIQGKFNPVELANIRIHSTSPKTFQVKVVDLDTHGIVWKGKVSFSTDKRSKKKVHSVVEWDDQKHYETSIKVHQEGRIFSFETMERLRK